MRRGCLANFCPVKTLVASYRPRRQLRQTRVPLHFFSRGRHVRWSLLRRGPLPPKGSAANAVLPRFPETKQGTSSSAATLDRWAENASSLERALIKADRSPLVPFPHTHLLPRDAADQRPNLAPRAPLCSILHSRPPSKAKMEPRRRSADDYPSHPTISRVTSSGQRNQLSSRWW